MENHWYRLAELYLTDRMELPELVKLCVINSALGVIRTNEKAKRVGVNVISRANLVDALVLGVIFHHTQRFPNTLIKYDEIGQILHYSRRTVALAGKRLLDTKRVKRVTYTGDGSQYVPFDQEPKELPYWVLDFTQALLELHLDNDLREKIKKECEPIEFYRGTQVLKLEIKEFFYPDEKNF